MEFSPGMASGSWTAGSGGFSNPYDSVSAGGGGGGDQLFPYDSPEPWLHGYFQEFPAYSGYHTFRPHNYKHVLAQMDVAGRWGLSPAMAYSHQWAHRYRQRSGMHPNFGAGSVSTGDPAFQNYAQLESGPTGGAVAPQPFPQPMSQQSQLQQAAAIERGYPDTAIPGITTPVYQLSRSLREPPRPDPRLSEEYLNHLDALQKQLEEQTFQMQLLQRQIQDKSKLPEWQQPNYLQFQQQQSSASQQAAALSRNFAGANGGYQELAPPPSNGVSQPGLLNVPQDSFAPAWQQDPLQQSYPQAQPQGFAPQPMNGGYPAQQPMNQPAVPQSYSPAQPGPILQIPAGQAYFSNQQSMQQFASAPGYGQQGYPQQGYAKQGYTQQGYGQQMMPSQGTIPGMHAGYQQPTQGPFGGAAGYPMQQSLPQSYPQQPAAFPYPQQAVPMQQYPASQYGRP